MRHEPKQTPTNTRTLLSLLLQLPFKAPPYLQIHLQQLFVHRADDIQVFTLRFVCRGIHWLHRVESATLKEVYVI